MEDWLTGSKAAGAGAFADVPVMFPCGCCYTDQGICANDCINELYQKGLILQGPGEVFGCIHTPQARSVE